MRSLAALALIAGCAAVEPEAPPLPLLAEPPERPYREIGRVEARGTIGAPRSAAYEALRERARELGADALVKLGEERRYRPAPQPGTLADLDRIGEARPEVLDDPFRRGFFGYEGRGARTVAGYYWRVEGLAVAFEDRP